MKRLIALLLALVAVVGLASPAGADDPDGIIDGGTEIVCRYGTGGLLDIFEPITGVGSDPLCDAIGNDVKKKVKDAWQAVWDSVLGDIINSAADAVKWVLKKMLTVALLGPSVDLAGTGLWDGKATLAGMLTWLGLVIAAAGVMWQLGKMALTGQIKHAGRSLGGFAENMLLSAVGVGLFALLLTLGDALTRGLVDGTFADDGAAYEQIVAVLVPLGIANPITMLAVVGVLLLVGFIQMVLIYMRQSAIPIICLLLPVAGGGRAGGDATRKWAPKLITSGLVIVVYKPMLAVIICTGFAEWGHAGTLSEWLRGLATLILGILAPGPLTRIFAPFGETVGAGMASGGMSGAVGAAAGYFARDAKGGADGGEGGQAQPTTPVAHAQFVQQSMGPQNGSGGEDGQAGGDARAHAARNDRQPGADAAGRGVPGQASGDNAAPGTTPGAAGGQTAAGGAGRGAAAAAVGITVLDGVNNVVQGASNQIGNGGRTP